MNDSTVVKKLILKANLTAPKSKADYWLYVRACDLLNELQKAEREQREKKKKLKQEDDAMRSKGFVPTRRGGYRELGVYDG